MTYRIRTDGPDRIFHVTGRVGWRMMYLEGRWVKERIESAATQAAAELGVKVLAYALMDNHLHFVLQSPPGPLYRRLTSRRLPCRHRTPWPRGHQNSSVIAQFMRRVRSAVTRICQRELELTGRFWESRYDARPILSARSLAVRIAYDHRNPVVAGIVHAPEDYRWSSARTWATGAESGIPIVLDCPTVSTDPDELRRDVLSLQQCRALDECKELMGAVARDDGSATEVERILHRLGVLATADTRGLRSAT